MSKRLKYYIKPNNRPPIMNLENYSKITDVLLNHNKAVLSNIDMLTKPKSERLIEHIYLNKDKFKLVTSNLRKTYKKPIYFLQIVLQGLELMQIRIKQPSK